MSCYRLYRTVLGYKTDPGFANEKILINRNDEPATTESGSTTTGSGGMFPLKKLKKLSLKL